jgi:predicted GIY-YIG superfamily endonuclease
MLAKQRKRARNLDDRAIQQIVEILDGWSSPKLTWELLIEKILLCLRAEYTRQALHKHTRIKEAFAARKQELAERDPKEVKALTPEQQRIARLEAENERLKRENNNLLEQFNRWVYNGYTKQMDERMRDFMNQPLSPVHRDPSKKSSVVKIAGKRKEGSI